MEQPDSSMQPGGVNRGLDFDLGVESSRFKFSCAHFVAYPGFRERLHGHNYTLAFKIGGPVGNEGYIVRAEELNDVVRDFCKSLNEYFIVPMKSDVLTIRMEEKSVYIRTETGDDFMFPIGDCKLLPIAHTTSEEIGAYAIELIAAKLGLDRLRSIGSTWIEVYVAELPGQRARCRLYLDDDGAGRQEGVAATAGGAPPPTASGRP
eukprot:GHVU01197488.1.p1 GENE.GHVU01197488.1~~GHVU01197488.1.p1  ORF type:complete len:206 (+),score=40.46 GHVU01197488.1:221-838(+)